MQSLLWPFPSAHRQGLRRFGEVGTKAARLVGVDVTAHRYLQDICSQYLAHELACDGAVEGYVDRSAHLQMGVSRFFAFYVQRSTCSAVKGPAQVSALFRQGGTVGLPWDVRCKKLIGRANVNDRDALFLGEQQLL